MLAMAALGAALAGTVTVELRGLVADGRPVHLRLFNQEDAFPSPTRAVRTVSTTATATTLTVDLGELPPGRWAVSVHHDQDADGELDFRWLPPGPAEGTSASCASKPLAIPSWDGCSVQVGAGALVLRLEMWY